MKTFYNMFVNDMDYESTKKDSEKAKDIKENIKKFDQLTKRKKV